MMLHGSKAEDFISDDMPRKAKGPSKFKLGWFLLFSILALGLTLAVSFGCSSVATTNLHVYSVRPAALLKGLARFSEEASGANSSSSSITEDLLSADFGIADLPDQYLFGISGLCRHWNQTDETKCQHHFPQLPSLLAAVLEDSGSPSVHDSWMELLTSTNISTPNRDLTHKHYVTAGAGLLITSIFWAFFTITFTLSRPKLLGYSILLDIVDAIIAVTAAIMWTIILNSEASALRAAAPGISPRMQDEVHKLGPGMAFLWALTWCKLMVTPLMMLLWILLALIPLFCCAAAVRDSDRVRVDIHHNSRGDVVGEWFNRKRHRELEGWPGEEFER